MISIGQRPSRLPPWRRLSSLPSVSVALDPEILLVDRGEILRLSRRSRDAAPRRRHGLAPSSTLPVATGTVSRDIGAQELRREAGIFGRAYPQLEAAGQRRRGTGEARPKRPQCAIAPIGTGIDNGQQQQDCQNRADAPRIAPRQAGNRPADPQPAQRRRHPPLMRRPQQPRIFIQRCARAIAERLQRTVRQPARLLDAASCRRYIGPTAAPRRAHAPSRRRGKCNREQRENAGMRDARQSRQQVEQRSDRKNAEDAEGRPYCGPNPFPQQRRAGQPQPQSEPVFPAGGCSACATSAGR